MGKDAGEGQSIMRPGFMEVLQTSIEGKRERLRGQKELEKQEKIAAKRQMLIESFQERSRDLFYIYTSLGYDELNALRKIDLERLYNFLTRKAVWRVIMKSPLLLAELAALFVPPLLAALDTSTLTYEPSIMEYLFRYLISLAVSSALWGMANIFLAGVGALDWLTRDVRYLIDRLRLSRSEAVKLLEKS